MIISGEASGDIYGCHLVQAMKELDPNLEIVGMCGQKMAQAGVNILFDMKGLSCIGAVEILSKIPKFLHRLKEVIEYIDKERPDLLILIDFPEFNMRLAKKIKALMPQISIVYYIPPTVWAWRKNRAKTIAKITDKVISILPFDAEIYKQAGANVEFVGHPLIDIVPTVSKMGREQACKLFGLNPNQRIIGLMPGSRQKEITALISIMFDGASKLLTAISDCQFILPLASTISEEDISCYKTPVPYTIIKDNQYEAMSICDILIVASGTATLEAACLGIPMIIVYKLNWLTWKLGQLLVNLNHIGLPNIIAGKEIVPELLQEQATAQNIFEYAYSLLQDEAKLLTIKNELSVVCQKLGNSGATKRAAEIALQTQGSATGTAIFRPLGELH